MTMNTVKRSIVFEKRRSSEGVISFRKATGLSSSSASTPNSQSNAEPKFAPDFQTEKRSALRQIYDGFHHALGGVPYVASTKKVGLVSASDKEDGPLKYIKDAQHSYGVDLSHFYHWGVAQSRLHRAQLVNGDMTNTTLAQMGHYAPRISDQMQHLSSALRTGLTSEDPESNAAQHAAALQSELDAHDHYVGTLRVIQAYRKLNQGIDPSKIYSSENWDQEDYDGEKDHRDHPLVRYGSLSIWQQDDPLFQKAKAGLTTKETIARGAFKSGGRGDIRGFSLLPSKINPVAPFIFDKNSSDEWNKHGKNFHYPEVTIPTVPLSYEKLLSNPTSNFNEIKKLVNSDTLSKGVFENKVDLAKIAAKKYAEQAWTRYEASIKTDSSAWAKRMQDLGVYTSANGLDFSGLDTYDTSNLSYKEAMFHKLAKKIMDHHKESFIKYLSNIYTSEIINSGGKPMNVENLDYRNLFKKIEKFDTDMDEASGDLSENNHWSSLFSEAHSPLSKIDDMWKAFSANPLKKKETSSGINIDEKISTLTKLFMDKIHDTYAGDLESGYKEATASKGLHHADLWRTALDPVFLPDADGFPAEELSTKKGMFLQKISDKYQLLHSMLNAVSQAGSKNTNYEKIMSTIIKNLVENTSWSHLRYGRVVKKGSSFSLFPTGIEKSFFKNYEVLYKNIANSLHDSCEHAIHSAQFALSHTTTVVAKPVLLNSLAYVEIEKSLKKYLQDNDGD